MAYNPSKIEEVAGRMVDAAFPTQSTPSRAERIANFELAQREMAGLCTEAIFDITKGQAPHHSVIVPMGIYATREALASLVRTDRVGIEIAGGVAEEMQTLCTHLRSRIDLTPSNWQTIGFAAELGVANVVCSGIAEGQLNLSYGILMGTAGYDKRRAGLKRDVDFVAKTRDGGKNARRKVQIKSSHRLARNVYDDDITVVAAQDLVGEKTVVDSISKLLKWGQLDPDEKRPTYRWLEERLRLVKKSKPSV